MDANYLKSFEEEIAKIYETGAIRGPIHLRDGNEDNLIGIFQYIRPQDYVFSTWANHSHALLKGIPQNEVRDRILQGDSMAMNFPQYNFFTSAIVGGCPPIAVGVAEAIKRKKEDRWVYCFVGDMGFQCGVTHECIKYSIKHNLPVYWIVEDNSKSVDTPTLEICLKPERMVDFYNKLARIQKNKRPTGTYSKRKVDYYTFTSKYPHSGCGTFVSF